ncbi:MAG: ATP-dependent DNA ligase [Terriglobales bacterium]|jgi:DNA ligase-1
MLQFAQTADAIAATNSKLAKTALVATYFRGLPVDQAAIAAIFLSGRPFAAYDERTLQVGGSLLWRAIAELSGKSEDELTEIYRRRGDAGSVAAEALPPKSEAGLSLPDVQDAFVEIAAARGAANKAHLLRELLRRATPLEAKYVVKIVSGDLRIGLKESLVEEAIARAFDAPLDQVKRANMLLGDLGETLRLAASGKLGEARLRLFHPIDFMLASPVESAEEALSYFENAAVEDKFDGIRAQAHISEGKVRLFSRTRDDITESFPELPPALAALSEDAILDGEIVAWSPGAAESGGEGEPKADYGRALPFSTLQQRLGRKKVSPKLLREIPVAYLVFDVIFVGGNLLLDHQLRERALTLDRLLAPDAARAAAAHSQAVRSSGQSLFDFAAEVPSPAAVIRAPVANAHTAQDLERLFVAARDRGNEGLMIKDLDSRYTPGRRGKSWLKMKRELATLDVVVTAVEYGHGKRIGVLSDYTFAVWDGERLVNIGKAYSGLTDAEIAEMTKWFLAHKTSEHGLRLEVEPKIVLEVAFNNMMQSSRHESGYALRFPRIVRLRPDKLPEDADTIVTVREIFERQSHNQ